MKKILAISIIAMTAVSAANAEIASKAYVDQQDGTLQTAINTLNGDGENSVAGKIATALQSYTTTGNDTNYVKTVTTTGDGNVVSGISANQNGTVTVTKGISALQAADIAGKQDIQIGTATTDTGKAVVVDAQGKIGMSTDKLGSAAWVDTTTFDAAGSASAAQTAAEGYTDTAIAGLDATKSQTAGTDGLALSITEENGKITSISGSIAAGTYDAAGSASAAETAAKGYTDTAIAGLDATKSQTAGTDGLALSITEENGKITSISGSIAANTYDAYGAASTALSGLDLTAVTGVIKSVSQTDGQVAASSGTVDTDDISANAVTLAKLGTSLPADCQESGTDCALVSHSGALAWEVIARVTNEALANTGHSSVPAAQQGQ